MLTLTFNCDGVPVFKSSKFNMWPILCSVNELPPNIRSKHVLLCGLWFGMEKPKMFSFLEPFVNECIQLSKTGLNWQDPRDDSLKNIKVYTLCGVCDSVAKPLVQNFKQFNGKYGCSLCLHPGEQVKKGCGTVRVYPHTSEIPEEREHTTTVALSEIAVREGTDILGVKGPSPLINMPKFDLIHGMVPDYMHCVLLGVCRQLATLWFESKYHRQPWYIGNCMREVDKFLLSIQPPSSISRTPRSITLRKYWKAHEWQTWLLYYSLPLLKDMLPTAYYSHWALLVEGISVLLSSNLSREDITHANEALAYFVACVEDLYGKEHMSFNIHMLLHLAKSVTNWGPLWCHSAFVFENCNGKLLDLVKNSKDVPLQVCKNFLILRALPQIAKPHLRNASAEFQLFFSRMTSTDHHIHSVEKYNGVTALGAPKIRIISEKHYICLHTALSTVDSSTIVKYYERIVVNEEVIHSQKYTRCVKRNNCIVMLKDKSAFKISIFIALMTDKGQEQCYAIGRHGHCTNQTLVKRATVKTTLSYMKSVRFPLTYPLVAVDCQTIVGKCMVITCRKSNDILCQMIKIYDSK
ncbi:UNVERIFIED_CONTAM: hypothetical protein FKN15_057450 [Acipenser sinensis]